MPTEGGGAGWGPARHGEAGQELASAPVLVVDDDELALTALAATLEPLGQEIVFAGSGHQAIAALRARQFAVVLLDVAMPGLDGLQTAALIKHRQETCHVPIIFLTGSAEREQLLRAYAAGAADYLPKPFEPEILRAKVAVFVDLYQLRQQAEVLTHRALHDPLTGLPNRTLFLDRLDRALAALDRRSEVVAVLFLDLNGFKQVNDRLGHRAGDRLLVEVTARLQTAIRTTDTAARFGGDEFLVLCEGIHTPEEAERTAARIQDALAAPFRLDKQQLSLQASVGIALAEDAGRSPEDIIHEADTAMLAAKHHRQPHASARQPATASAP